MGDHKGLGGVRTSIVAVDEDDALRAAVACELVLDNLNLVVGANYRDHRADLGSILGAAKTSILVITGKVGQPSVVVDLVSLVTGRVGQDVRCEYVALDEHGPIEVD